MTVNINLQILRPYSGDAVAMTVNRQEVEEQIKKMLDEDRLFEAAWVSFRASVDDNVNETEIHRAFFNGALFLRNLFQSAHEMANDGHSDEANDLINMIFREIVLACQEHGRRRNKPDPFAVEISFEVLRNRMN